MSPYTERRHHPRVSVEWPVLYSTPTFSAHGTVIDVSALAWRVEGSTPVHKGMQLAVELWLSPSAHFDIHEARVLWAHEDEFAIEIQQVCPAHESALISLQEQTLAKHGGQEGFSRGDQPDAKRRWRSVLPSAELERGPRESRVRKMPSHLLAHCHWQYEPGTVAEGLLQALSSTGCEFLSAACLEQGSRVTVTLYFSDGQPPMSLPGSRVCWATGRAINVQFPPITSHERRRLEATTGSDRPLLLNGPHNEHVSTSYDRKR